MVLGGASIQFSSAAAIPPDGTVLGGQVGMVIINGCAIPTLYSPSRLPGGKLILGVLKGAQDHFLSAFNLTKVSHDFIGQRANAVPSLSASFLDDVSLRAHDPNHGETRCEQLRGHRPERFTENER